MTRVASEAEIREVERKVERGPRSGYLLRGGGLEPSLVEFLLDEVREGYAAGEFVELGELEERTAAALRGDEAGATGQPFPKPRMELRR